MCLFGWEDLCWLLVTWLDGWMAGWLDGCLFSFY